MGLGLDENEPGAVMYGLSQLVLEVFFLVVHEDVRVEHAGPELFFKLLLLFNGSVGDAVVRKNPFEVVYCPAPVVALLIGVVLILFRMLCRYQNDRFGGNLLRDIQNDEPDRECLLLLLVQDVVRGLAGDGVNSSSQAGKVEAARIALPRAGVDTVDNALHSREVVGSVQGKGC